ncbi:NUDIX hydrolase [Maribacter sp. 2304DJ31-5]|uniref:NUDIX hydrolase n=1 Tax=Maribacter sp. 2304DJ31-5 TaxID=3386273 RepID=UPI0039BC6193
MDELVDILDPEGNLTGKTAMKSLAHQKGLFHPTVHVWLYTRQGELLLQQRGKNKDTYPMLWDVSVAGHIGAGESITASAIREIEEEIGLHIKPEGLNKIGVFKSVHKHHEDLIDCEFHHTFLSELKVPFGNLIKQESEVEDLTLVPIDQFKTELTDKSKKDKYVPHKTAYYQAVISAIESLIGKL